MREEIRSENEGCGKKFPIDFAPPSSEEGWERFQFHSGVVGEGIGDFYKSGNGEDGMDNVCGGVRIDLFDSREKSLMKAYF
jgi:hypothetical protein